MPPLPTLTPKSPKVQDLDRYRWCKIVTCIQWLPTSLKLVYMRISNSYTMGCPPVRGDNPRAFASGLSYVQVDKHGLTTRILYHLH